MALRLTVFADHDLRHPLAGGANVNLESNLRRFSANIKTTLLCAWAPGLPEKETIEGIEVLRFKGNLATLRWTIPRYYKKHLENQTDVVWDEVDFSVPWLTPLFAKKPIVMHCHHVQKRNFFDELPAWKAAGAYLLEPRLYRLYRKSTTFAVSESTRKDLLDLGFRPEKVHVFPPALDAKTLGRPRDFSRKSPTPLVVALSRLRAWKGVQYSIRAFAQVVKDLPDAKLAVIGSGPFEGRLRELTSQLKLDSKVQFLGRLGEKDKLEWLDRAHVLTKTSGREGWGIDVLEANACMTPAVGWDVPGTRDSIRQGETGVLVPFGNVGALAREVSSLLKDTSRRQALASQAMQFSSQFTWDKSAAGMESILTGLAGSKS